MDKPYEFTGEKKRVLIVDDIRTDLHYVGKLVTGFGHEAILADSAASALEMIDGETDIVIADGIMPDMDGFDLVKSIRNNNAISHIPVIMVTSLSGKSDRLKAVEAGINDYISKPVDKVELKVRVNSMLKMKEAQDKVRDYQKELENLVEKKTRALSTTLNKLHAVLNGISDCVVTLDSEHLITEVNVAFQRVTGKSESELKGCSFDDLLIGGDQFDEFKQILDPSSDLYHAEVEFPQWSGKTFSIVVTHMNDNDLILVMRDITEKRQADTQRARFLSILSHELRTPLNGIKGFSEVMLNDTSGLSDEYRDYMGMIFDCGCQLETIVEELLNFVQLYNGHDDRADLDINLEAAVTEVLSQVDEKYPDKNVTFSVNVTGGPAVVHGKSEHFVEIISQIVDNAVKFNDAAGRVEIFLETGKSSVKFICKDTGQGIPSIMIDKVFDSFYQVETYITRTREGLGLGLTIAKKMVEMYKGTIRIESEEGRGTEVTLVFPRP